MIIFKINIQSLCFAILAFVICAPIAMASAPIEDKVTEIQKNTQMAIMSRFNAQIREIVAAKFICR